MMMKEHIVDRYGAIKYTMGNGCSGGSINAQHERARSARDCSTASSRVCDLPRLDDHRHRGRRLRAAGRRPTQTPEWTALMARPDAGADQRKEDGDQRPPRPDRLPGWNNAFGINNKPGNYVPHARGQPRPPARSHRRRRAAQQLPAAGRAGLRPGDQPERHALRRSRLGSCCLGHDGERLRRVPAGTLRARRPRDNVGIQYGLKACSGRDHGRGVRHARTRRSAASTPTPTARASALRRRPARRSTSPTAPASCASGKNLGKLAIIDSRGWDEPGIHYIWRSFSERARIDAARTAATTATR